MKALHLVLFRLHYASKDFFGFSLLEISKEFGDERCLFSINVDLMYRKIYFDILFLHFERGI